MNKSKSRREATALRVLQIRHKAPDLSRSRAEPRFVADVMLGRLAKWLRIAGFDVLYSNQFSDDELVMLSRNQGRILLSRDTRLLIRKAVQQFIFLESEKVQEQIHQILTTMEAECLPGILTRCLECNEKLAEISKDGLEGSVPSFVFKTQSKFKLCPRCSKIFWAGTHRQAVLRSLAAVIRGFSRP